MNRLLKYSLLFISGSLLLTGLFGCAKKDETIDYVNNGDVKLKLDYKDHNFLKDGIGQVELKTAIDGDTAHFTLLDGNDFIKCRFYGIDTPESTGKVEPYGKAASNFTKEKLTNASKNGTIVVSSPTDEYQVPEFDSTGTRYLSLIWINEDVKNASYDSLISLNLWIVQEGYSYVKAVEKVPDYADTFYSAEEQAKAQKLNLFSSEDDPLYNYGDYSDVSLLELKNEIVAQVKDSTHENKYNGAKVRVRGTVAGFANRILYLQASYLQDDGTYEYAGINVFVGMGSILSKFTTVNTYLQLCGTCEDSENFGFQITGVYSWKYTAKDENDTAVLYTANEIPEEYKVHDFKLDSTKVLENDYSYLFSPIYINDKVIVDGGYTSDGDICLYLKNNDGEDLYYSAYISFTYRPDETNKPNLIWDDYNYFVGKTFTLSGIYSFHKGTKGYSFQINPRSNLDFVCESL